MTANAYPVHVDAELDQPLSRWLWLVKWLLLVPHFVVLVFLWVAFALMTVLAFFAILVTGRYPRALFDFDVGVLRWSWRVAYYGTGALATDRYPPFTLADVPDYPAHLSVDYPERLSRGLVLVKWWLLAIPHYVVVAFFVGSGSWATWHVGDETVEVGWGGLVTVLVVIAAVVLLFTGTYPRSLYDFVLGMDRWALRVAGYACLMTDEYPPFRLDMGGPDPAPSLAAVATTGAGTPATPGPSHRWTAGRVVTLVVGALMAAISLGLLAGGGAALWADQVLRDDDGYLTSPTRVLSTGQYAVRSERIDLGEADVSWALPDRWLGTVRLRATPTTEGAAVFVGVARTVDVSAYLSAAGYATVTALNQGTTTYREHDGGPPPTLPGEQTFWSARASGTGPQRLTWEPQPGLWTLVVMNADASPGVAVRADLGATVPALGWLWVTLLVAGMVLLVVAGTVIVVAVVSASRP